ncbi:hypothetical protein EDD18DRAFT_1109922 [Armillaria luteobubalina]|uniref:Uncharacterized protein n=1 Tax=Armillaria luteobubalina TaxID=153913 RepID=A0AA39THY2_9AGAR|nr:hypothetical protein EDD18DRAFT_1109922 [Armillaria luteobubalina]
MAAVGAVFQGWKAHLKTRFFTPSNCIALSLKPTKHYHELHEKCKVFSYMQFYKVSNNIYLLDILGTKEGIEALALFLDKSGAFMKTGNPKQPLMHHTLEEEECILEDWLGNHNSVE